ncbi:MAG: response regulator transcription factor [Gemmatimonadales bacterium]
MSSRDRDPTSGSTGQSQRWVGIVDDDASIRRSLSRVLRLEGVCVETFASAEEFLARIALGAPQCLVLDVHLGALSGFDLQDRLTSEGAAPPIIFITAHGEIPSGRLAPHTGASGYLRKPFDTAALVALVRPFLCQVVTAPPPLGSG